MNREMFETITVRDTIYAIRQDPLEIITKLHFEKQGVEVAIATVYSSGNLYCNWEYLPLAIEYLTNSLSHIKWRYIRGVGLV